jgi:hypothetical protein
LAILKVRYGFESLVDLTFRVMFEVVGRMVDVEENLLPRTQLIANQFSPSQFKQRSICRQVD